MQNSAQNPDLQLVGSNTACLGWSGQDHGGEMHRKHEKCHTNPPNSNRICIQAQPSNPLKRPSNPPFDPLEPTLRAVEPTGNALNPGTDITRTRTGGAHSAATQQPPVAHSGSPKNKFSHTNPSTSIESAQTEKRNPIKTHRIARFYPKNRPEKPISRGRQPIPSSTSSNRSRTILIRDVCYNQFATELPL